jgi:hypothetical protein
LAAYWLQCTLQCLQWVKHSNYFLVGFSLKLIRNITHATFSCY